MAVLACGCLEGSGVPLMGRSEQTWDHRDPTSSSLHLEGPVQGTEPVVQGCGQCHGPPCRAAACPMVSRVEQAIPGGCGLLVCRFTGLLKVHLGVPTGPRPCY